MNGNEIVELIELVRRLTIAVEKLAEMAEKEMARG